MGHHGSMPKGLFVTFARVHMYQRSGDMGRGVPYKIASYALLTLLTVKVCNLEVGNIVHTVGDAHMYLSHVDAMKEQPTRTPRPFPLLPINPSVNWTVMWGGTILLKILSR